MVKRERERERERESYQLGRLGGRMRRSKQKLHLRENAIEAYLDVETLSRMKIIEINKEAKKTVREVRFKAYDELCS